MIDTFALQKKKISTFSLLIIRHFGGAIFLWSEKRPGIAQKIWKGRKGARCYNVRREGFYSLNSCVVNLHFAVRCARNFAQKDTLSLIGLYEVDVFDPKKRQNHRRKPSTTAEIYKSEVTLSGLLVNMFEQLR